MAQAFFGGVHPNDMKAATNEKAIEQLAPPAEVVIPMSMHFGAPCTPLVKAGDQVKVGQKIGETRGLGAPIHASVSGKVKAVEPRPYNMGGNMMAVVIENDFQDTLSEEVQLHIYITCCLIGDTTYVPFVSTSPGHYGILAKFCCKHTCLIPVYRARGNIIAAIGIHII